MNKQLDYLKVVILGQLTIEAIEDLKETTKYRQDVKFLGNRFINMLEKYVNQDFNTVYNNNEEMTMNVMRKITELINKIATSDIDNLVMIDAVIDKYKENKEWFVEHASAEFLKLD
jgi:ABC-type microcin C transport system permease subunit YejB